MTPSPKNSLEAKSEPHHEPRNDQLSIHSDQDSPEGLQHGDRKSGSVSRKSSAESGRPGEPGHVPEILTDTLDKDNPFERDNEKELAEKVRSYARMDPELAKDTELLEHGAQLAQNTSNALSNPFFKGLTVKQRYYLGDRDETVVEQAQIGDKLVREDDAGFWGQSKYLKGSVLSACLAGIIQGWTQSAMNGANLGLSQEFNLSNQWLFGLVNAIPFFAGGMLAPFFSDPLQEYFLGRRGAIAAACILSIAATVGQSFSTSIGQVIGCRIITGLTLAAKASSAPLLTAEVAPNHLRGNLLATWQLSDAFGIFLGFSSNLATLNIHAQNKAIWRIQIATTIIPTTILLFLVYFMPESPRYLMKRGRPVKALESFTMLRPPPVSRLLAARDQVYAHFQLQAECSSIQNRKSSRKFGGEPNKSSERSPMRNENEKQTASDNGKGPEVKESPRDGDLESQHQTTPETPLYVTEGLKRRVFPEFSKRMRQLFNDDRSRRALVCASTAMVSQQLCGVNTIAFLSTTLLNGVNASPRSGAWVGFGIGLCNFVFGAPAFWLLDVIGRATLLLLGFIPMFVLMLILAFSFKENAAGVQVARVPLVAVFGILYIIAYSPTAGTSPFAISAEVFPLIVREVGHSFAVGVNFLGLAIVLLVFPSMSAAMGGYRGSLSLFATLNLVAFVLCFLFVPETKGRSLEELRSIFDIPTREHIKYRCTCVAPWLWRKFPHFVKAKVDWWFKSTGKEKADEYRLVDFPVWYKGELVKRRTK
ncbi:major facilitator superfamily domain-containing protein [Rhexocercosporidium sp. MPI-PUGE-AT-0058]|nr:major facilitator superfamily domain-containing protein [Rhexocercosporidium sp. MPI-PUGE-AT-0058]